MKPYYYVYRVRDDDFAARLPIVRHATIEEAQVEAERLAEKHKGVSFEILKAVAISCVPKPTVTFFMNEELSPYPWSSQFGSKF